MPRGDDDFEDEEEEEVEDVEEVEVEDVEEVEVEDIEEVEVEDEVEVIGEEEEEGEKEGDEEEKVEEVEDEGIKRSEDEREELTEEDQEGAAEEFADRKEDPADGEGETEKEQPQEIVDDRPNHPQQTQISPEEEEAKESDGHESPVLKETNHLGDHTKPAFHSTTILESDGRNSPLLGKIDHLESNSIAGLDHGKHPISMQTDFPGNHARSVLEPVSTAGLLAGNSPVTRLTDISENHARPTLVRSRSPSADVTLEMSNKKPAVICDFYAKGWCIKGSSCRFSHQKEHSQNSRTGRPLGRECIDDPGVSTSNLLQRALVRAYGEEKPPMSHISNENSLAMSGKREMMTRNEAKVDLLNEGPARSTVSGISLSQISNENSLAISGKKETMIRNEAKVDLLNEGPVISTVSGISLSPAQLYSSTSSSVGMRMFDSSYNSRDWDLGTRKPPSHFESVKSFSSDVTLGYQPDASLSRGTLPSGYLSANHKSVLLGYKKHVITSAWEPSVPFRSSICPVAPPLLSANDQYDPLIDSMEPAKGSTSTSGLRNHDSVPRENASPGYRDFKLADPFRVSLETRADNVHGKGHGLSVGIESGFDITYPGHKSSIFEGLKNSPVYASDPSNVKKDLPERTLKLQEDRSSHFKESKALKVFRGSVADFVKDLLKPSWIGGHLSKEAHKLIVKKAVEKVCGALQPHQIPSSVESTNQYFFSNRPKLVKLVEGYVEKYAKS